MKKYKTPKIKVVSFGGGTGLSVLLGGVHRFYPNYIDNITAVVATSDTGGSTGILRQEFNIPAPGDIRKCIAALSPRHDVLHKLFEFRFKNPKSSLNKHSLGNLILTALTEITGSFATAVKEACKILNTIGQVLPISEENIQLVAQFDNGQIIHGEIPIYQYGKLQKGRITKIWLEPKNLKVTPEVIRAINNADLITFGPGSLYTSTIASLLPKAIKKALKTSKATKVFIVNLLTDYGETYKFDAFDHYCTLTKHIKTHVDAVIINTGPIPQNIKTHYFKTERAEPVKPSIEKFPKDVKIITGDFVKIENKKVRHNAIKVWEAITPHVYN